MLGNHTILPWIRPKEPQTTWRDPHLLFQRVSFKLLHALLGTLLQPAVHLMAFFFWQIWWCIPAHLKKVNIYIFNVYVNIYIYVYSWTPKPWKMIFSIPRKRAIGVVIPKNEGCGCPFPWHILLITTVKMTIDYRSGKHWIWIHNVLYSKPTWQWTKMDLSWRCIPPTWQWKP